MLNRLVSVVACSQQSLAAKSLRLLYTSSPKLGDGDHTPSKALHNAAVDLKTRKEQRWLDTTASDSEAIVKSERKDAMSQGEVEKDVTNLQEDTVEAIREKAKKGHLPQFDVGRRDKREDRIGSGGSHKKEC